MTGSNKVIGQKQTDDPGALGRPKIPIQPEHLVAT